MSTPQKLMAERIAGLRSVLDISVAEMAKVCDVKEEKYLDLESGNEDMSFTFLYKCATRFGIDISELVTGEMPKLSAYNLCRKGEGMPIRRREGFEYQHIAPLLKHRLSEPFLVVAKYDSALEHEPIMLSDHTGQELNYVLSGSLKVQVDEHIEILNPGDSIYYNANRKHGMIALNGEDCEFLAIVLKGTQETESTQIETATDAKLNTGSELLYKQFVNETLDENGFLKDISFNIPDNFNFAYDVVDKLAQSSPDKTAMVWVSREKEKKVFSFSDISKYSSKTANYLTSLGIKKGDKVMLVLKRHYQFWFLITALHKMGAVVIPATNLLTPKDFEYRFNAAGVKAIIATSDGDVCANADEAISKYPDLEVKISVNGSVDGWRNFDTDVELFSETFKRPSELFATDNMLMYFTSGTTGYPKIAAHNFTYPLGHIVTARFWHNVDPNGLHFTISDTGWGKSVWGKLYGQWLCEAAIFTYDFDKFDAEDILSMFKEHNITTFCAPPTMYRFFIKCDLKKYDLSSLKHATIAGEALNPEVYEQFKTATGLKLMEGFGQTESTLTIANLVGTNPKPGSMGKPSPQYDVDLLGGDGLSTKVGEVGEIVVRTDTKLPCGMFCGYYRDEDKTKEVWNNGIYHTGDMAWRDEDGYFWYVGRTDDLIKSAGYRIGPFEIESVIMELPYVLECAVTGVPDEIRGQIVKATIVLTNGKNSTEELKKEIQNYVKEHTAPYKYPRIVEFAQSLPKTISGKIRRVELRGN